MSQGASATPGSPASTRPIHQRSRPASSKARSTAGTRSGGTAASSPPDVCGSWASVMLLVRDVRRDVERSRDVAAVVGRAAGLDARGGEVQRPGERRQPGRLEDEPGPGGARHLEPVAEEAEAGHVGRRPDAARDERLRRGAIEPSHAVDRGRQVRVGSSVPGGRPTRASRCRGAWSAGAGRRAARHPCAAADPDARRR